MRISKEDLRKLIELVRDVGYRNRIETSNWILNRYDHFLYEDQITRVLGSKIEVLKRAGILKEILPKIYVVNFDNLKKLLIFESKPEKTLKKIEKKEPKRISVNIKELIQYVAPEVIGKEAEKAAILLQLFSDLPERRGLMRYRIHILLVGAPGTAKTSLLYFIPKVVSKSKIIHPGTTEAGLRGSLRREVFKEMGSLLEQLNGGILIIDEFDKFKFEDIKDLLMAMEEGFVSIRGAEIELEFEARIRVAASANRFTFPQELLTRFDCIFYEKPYSTKELEEIADKMIDFYVHGELSGFVQKGIAIIKKLLRIRRRFVPRIVDVEGVKEMLKLIVRKEKENNIRWAIQRWQRLAFAYARLMGKNVDEKIIREVYELFKGKFYKPVTLV